MSVEVLYSFLSQISNIYLKVTPLVGELWFSCNSSMMYIIFCFNENKSMFLLMSIVVYFHPSSFKYGSVAWLSLMYILHFTNLQLFC